jgi:hypothetical protein
MRRYASRVILISLRFVMITIIREEES